MLDSQCPERGPDANARVLLDALGTRSLVLIGMMGAGKSSIGRRLANRLGLPFADADTEIESAAGMSISDIFARHGEPAFRSGEARVIARLLDMGPQVLATGGGAVMNDATREAIRAKAISIWLKADPEILLRRVKRRNDRPLLRTDDPAATLRSLLAVREPTYAQADLIIESREGPHNSVVEDTLSKLSRMLGVARTGSDAVAEAAR